MKVVINGTVFNSDIDPIVLVFDHDLERQAVAKRLTNMQPAASVTDVRLCAIIAESEHRSTPCPLRVLKEALKVFNEPVTSPDVKA